MIRFVILLFLVACNIQASLTDYIYPHRVTSYSNYGTLGVIQNPSARLLSEGSIGFTWTHNEPYLRGSIVAYPFNWLEAAFQYTDVNNQLYSDVRAFSGSQSLKDKSFDTKIRIITESKYLPQIAVGLRDVGGTGVFGGEFIVANKYIRNFDVSFGVGWGNLNANKISNPFRIFGDRFKNRPTNTSATGGEFNTNQLFHGDAGIFGGIEYFLPNMNGLRLKAEINSVNYETEGSKPLKKDSNINVGLVYPFNDFFQVKLSYIKGNQLSFGFSLSGNVGKKSSGRKKSDPYLSVENSEAVKKVTSKDNDLLYKATLKYLRERDIYVQAATLKDNGEYEVAISQNKYLSYPMAAGRTARLINEISPERVKEIKISSLNGENGMHSISIDRDTLKRSLANQSPIFNHDVDTSPLTYNQKNYDFVPAKAYPFHFYKFGPDLRTQIGGPDGFFFGDLRLAYSSEVLFAPNFSLITDAAIGLTNNMGDLKLASDSIIPHVRTDIVKYLKASQDFNITRMQLNYFFNPTKNMYGKISGGLLESMFGGIGGEILYRPFYKNYAIGAELWRVQQRDFNQLFDFQKYKITTGHINMYYEEPRSRVLFNLKGGKYLAGDSGFTFDFSRRFDNGLIMGAFFSLTDISKEEFGEGSFDKGFYFWWPLNLFYGNYTREMDGWGLRPLTRDGAQFLLHGYHLWGTTDSAWNSRLERDIDDFNN